MTASATFGKSDLRQAVRLFRRVVERRNLIPVLSMVHFSIGEGRAILSGTNLDTEIRIAIDAQCTGAASFVLDLRSLAALVDAADTAITFTYLPPPPAATDEKKHKSAFGKISVESGGLRALINAHIEASDFPFMGSAMAKVTAADGTELPPVNTYEIWSQGAAPPIEVLNGDLRRLFAMSRFAVSNEETRYYLNGCFLCQKPGGKTIRCVATDGHRMAVVDSEIPFQFEPAILPKRLVDLLLDLLARPSNEAASIRFGGRYLTLTCGAVSVIAKMIDGTFPAYERVIPSAEPKIRAEISRPSVLRLERVCAAGRSKFTSVAVRIAPDEGIMTGILPDWGEVSAPVAGEGHAFGVKSSYLAQLARLMPSFTMLGAGDRDPFLISGEDPNAFFILMPMRI